MFYVLPSKSVSRGRNLGSGGGFEAVGFGVLASGVFLLAEFCVGFGEELVGLDGFGLDGGGFLEIGEAACGVSLQGEDAAAEQVGAVMVGVELKGNVQMIQGFWNAIDSGVHGSQGELGVGPARRVGHSNLKLFCGAWPVASFKQR